MGQPGEILAVTANDFTVAAKGGAIQVKRVKLEGAAKIGAGEFAASAGLRAGSKLG